MKIIKVIRNFMLVFTFSALCLLLYGFYSVPDELFAVTGERAQVSELYTITYSGTQAEYSGRERSSAEGKYEVNVSLLGALPIKNSSLTVSERVYVVPSGKIFGLRLFTSGVVIVKTDTVDTAEGYASPSEKAGLMRGDVIMKIDSQAISSSAQLSEILSVEKSEGYTVEYLRDKKAYTAVIYPVYSQSEGKFKAGLWVRDSAAGIGTMTFYHSDSGMFAGLGHGVCDADTGEILPFSDGDIVSAKISGCTKGEKGKAGELCGTFDGGAIGVLYSNNEKGVYGVLSSVNKRQKHLPVAMAHEVEEGKAQIISSVDDKGPAYYDIEIKKISKTASQEKSMTIKVTDPELIEKTGGIVQGMSGSPIIQNGMLVGAVTHVFLNDSTQGYGIFAEYMLSQGEKIMNSVQLEKAS